MAHPCIHLVAQWFEEVWAFASASLAGGMRRAGPAGRPIQPEAGRQGRWLSWGQVETTGWAPP